MTRLRNKYFSMHPIGDDRGSLFSHITLSKKQCILAVIFASITGVIMSLCDAIDTHGYFNFNHALGHTILLICILITFFVSLALIGPLIVDEKKNSCTRATERLSIKNIFSYALIIFICWLPWLVALYPANFLGDTLISIGWFTGLIDGKSNMLSDHNPIFTVLLFGGMAQLGKIIHNAGLVFFAFVLVQAAVSAVIFAISAEFIYRRGNVKVLYRNILIAFYALCPLFPVWSTFLAKDTLFAPAFLLWFIYFIAALRSDGTIFSSTTQTVFFTLLTIYACLVKKLGTYILIPSIIAALAFFILRYKKKHSKNDLKETRYLRNLTISTCISLLTLLVLLPKIVLPLCGVKPSEHYEMLSVQLQQTARYLSDHPDDITPYEYQAIDKLLDCTDLATRWQWFLSDPVKYRIKEPTDAYGDWEKAYIAEGLRHPYSYFQTYVALESGFGKSDSTIAVQLDSSFMKDYDSSSIPSAYTSTGWSVKSGQVADNIYHRIETMPIIHLLFLAPVYTLIIPMMYVYSLFAGKRRKLALFILAIPLLLTEAGLWISPISIWVLGSRYLLPLLYIGPLLLTETLLSFSNVTNQEVEPSDSSQSDPRLRPSHQ